MLTALAHFAFGFVVMAAISYMHARWLGEKNGSMIAAGLVSGILCASLATFMTPWASPATRMSPIPDCIGLAVRRVKRLLLRC